MDKLGFRLVLLRQANWCFAQTTLNVFLFWMFLHSLARFLLDVTICLRWNRKMHHITYTKGKHSALAMKTMEHWRFNNQRLQQFELFYSFQNSLNDRLSQIHETCVCKPRIDHEQISSIMRTTLSNHCSPSAESMMDWQPWPG